MSQDLGFTSPPYDVNWIFTLIAWIELDSLVLSFQMIGSTWSSDHELMGLTQGLEVSVDSQHDYPMIES